MLVLPSVPAETMQMRAMWLFIWQLRCSGSLLSERYS
jgi:hypothetical protein